MRIRHQGPSLVVDAPAKVNLSLKVLGRRPDGFHELETVLLSVGLFDTLRFEPQPDGRLSLSATMALPGANSSHSPDLSSHDNLVLDAARALQAATGCSAGAKITLVKRIPWQAGLGGGSSDAAATLVALNDVWDLGLSGEALHEIAASLGSDINFFLDSVPLAVCRGRGEQIEPALLRQPLHLLVVKPPSGLSTAEVFGGFSEYGSANTEIAQPARLSGIGLTPLSVLPVGNDLQSSAIKRSDDVRVTLGRLEEITNRCACLSGSGTACFSVCRSRAEARRLANRWNLSGFGRAYALEAAV